MATLKLEDISMEYEGKKVLNQINLDIPEGKYTVLVGPSGAGKTVLLRIIAGLEKPASGRIYLEDENITSRHPSKRDVAMVFQNLALYRHMSVYENLAFSLAAVGKDNKEIRSTVAGVASLLHIEELLGRRSQQLSGGQKQRVALGRALVRKPRLFLFDEPLGALDAKLRGEMIFELKRMQRKFEITTLHVTHNQLEAQSLGDYLAVLNGGNLEQFGSPDEVYDRPANLFVGTFIGFPPMNVFQTQGLALDGGKLMLNSGGAFVAVSGEMKRLLGGVDRIICGVRSENMEVSGEKSDDTFPAEVVAIEPYSNEVLLDIKLGKDIFKCRAYSATMDFQPEVGMTVWIRIRPERVHLFDPDTKGRVN